MGAIAQRVRARTAAFVRTGVLPVGTEVFTLPAGYYVVAYLLDGDPEQSEASRLTIGWANSYAADIEVVESVLVDTVRFAGIRTRRELPYPIEGKWLCLATATTVQDPIGVYGACSRKDTAQQEALGALASGKADIAQGGVAESAKLSDAAARAAIEALRDDGIPNWVPWAIGGTVGVIGLVALAKLVRG